jgi:hypothetical protein
LIAGQPCPFGELVELRVIGPGNENRWIQYACDGPRECVPPEDGEYTIPVTHQTADPVATPLRLRKSHPC